MMITYLNEQQLEEVGKNLKKSRKLLRYINKVFCFKDIAKSQKDSRKKQHVETQVIFTIVFWAFLFRIKSFNQLEQMIKYGCFNPLFPRSTKMPSIDAISNILAVWDTTQLQKSFQRIIQILNSNKNFKSGTIDGYTVCAIDGTDIVKSAYSKCKGCMLMKNGSAYHYVHKSVVAMIIGDESNYILKYKMAKVKSEEIVKDKKTYEDLLVTKSEGELTVAMEIIPELPSWVDIVVGDALYFNSPFIKEVLKHDKHAVIRLKNERTAAYQTMQHQAMYTQSEGSFVVKKSYEKITVSYWAKDTFISDSTLLKKDPKKHTDIRLFKFIEVIETKINDKENFAFREVFVGTTDKNMSPESVWQIIHQRWYIENTAFHQLKTQCFMEHCFRHDPTAIEAILGIMFMSFNLLRSFLFRRSKKFKASFKKKKETISWFITEVLFELTIVSFLMKCKLLNKAFLKSMYD